MTAAATPHITISEVTVSPSPAVPGEDVTIEVTIENLQSGSAVYRIDGLRLYRGTTEFDRIEDVGTVAVGSTVTVPLHATFEAVGTKNLKVQVWGNPVGENTQFPIRHPVSVTVTDAQPRIDIDVNDSVVGRTVNGTVTIANGLSRSMQNVEVTVDGPEQTIAGGRDVFASIDGTTTETLRFRVTPEVAGTHELTATVTYMTDPGTVRTVTSNTTYTASSLSGDVAVQTETERTGDGVRTTVSVRNRWNADVENVTVRARASNATFETGYVDRIPAGRSESVSLNATLQRPHTNATVVVTYEVGYRSERSTDHVTVSSPPSTVDLTGLDVTQENDKLHISGSASNLGTSDVESVLVSVVNTDAVDPAYPNREFFVGTVPASDFVTFDVYARTRGNVSTVPVEVSYLVDGERRRRLVRVPVQSAGDGDRPEVSTARSDGRTLAVVGVGTVVSLGVALIMAYAWRNSRDRDQD